MPSATIFMPENRLEGILLNPLAPTAEVLVVAAETRVGTLRESIRAYVRETSERIFLLAEKPEEEVFAECRALGLHAQSICEVASLAGWTTIGEAARGIIEMVEALINSGAWHTEALQLHVDALALLNKDPTPSDAVAEQILRQLKEMRERVGAL